MLSRKVLILLFISFVFPQNAMSGYGFGSSVDNSEASAVGVSNELLPSFKTNVSILIYVSNLHCLIIQISSLDRNSYFEC